MYSARYEAASSLFWKLDLADLFLRKCCILTKVWDQGAEKQTLFEIFVDISARIVYYSFCRQTTMREWLSGGAPPCQGGGRGFDPRLALLFFAQF